MDELQTLILFFHLIQEAIRSDKAIQASVYDFRFSPV